MKKYRNISALLLALLLFAGLAPGASALVSESGSFYSADYANVLSDETEQMIINYNGALEQQCQGAQIVVVTVDYLDGMNSDEYAYQLFNDWGVGSADYNNGMLLLLATQENKAWLAYGLGLNSQMSDTTVDDLLNKYFWTDFDKGNYDEAVTKLFKALLSWYDDVYDSDTADAGTASSNSGSQNSGGSSFSFSGIIRTVVVIAIIMAIFGSGNNRGGGGSWLPWLLCLGSQSRNRRGPFDGGGSWPRGGGGFGGGSGRGGGGFGGGGFGGGFGGGGGHGGGGFSGGGGGRR